MKLYHEDEAEAILAAGGLLLETVDCRVCGAIMVPHLITTDGEPYGLCAEHFAGPGRPLDEEGAP